MCSGSPALSHSDFSCLCLLCIKYRRDNEKWFVAGPPYSNRKTFRGCHERDSEPAISRPFQSPNSPLTGPHSLGQLFDLGLGLGCCRKAGHQPGSLRPQSLPPSPTIRPVTVPGPWPFLQRNLFKNSGFRSRPGEDQPGMGMVAQAWEVLVEATGPRYSPRLRKVGSSPFSAALRSALPILPPASPPAFQIPKMFPPVTEKCPNRL